MALLKRYPYPGNVRELMNVVAGSYYGTAGQIINVENLPPEIRRDDRATGNDGRNNFV